MSSVFDWFHRPAAGYHLLRLTTAALMLLHGIAKLKGGVSGIEGMLAGLGLPGFLAYGVYIGEVLAPLLILANWFVVPAALVMAFNMVVAVGLAHMSHIFALTKTGGWALELQALYLVASLAIALLAPRQVRLGKNG